MKKTRRILALSLAMITLCTLFAGCASGNGSDTTAADTTGASPETTVPATQEGTTEEQTEPEVIPSGSIKILAIGNSFSTDCMQYLWQMLRGAGYDEVILGNLYYGGCSLAQHLGFARADSESYTYYKNTNGTWGSTGNDKLSRGLAVILR